MTLSPLICDGIVALVTMALLPSSSWHCQPCCNGVIVIIDVQMSLPSLRWRCCPCHDGVVVLQTQAPLPLSQLQLLPLLQWGLCRSQTSVVIKLALTPLLQWGHCHHQSAGVFAVVELALLPSLQLCCRH
jgi:hypothetical protein